MAGKFRTAAYFGQGNRYGNNREPKRAQNVTRISTTILVRAGAKLFLSPILMKFLLRLWLGSYSHLKDRTYSWIAAVGARQFCDRCRGGQKSQIQREVRIVLFMQECLLVLLSTSLLIVGIGHTAPASIFDRVKSGTIGPYVWAQQCNSIRLSGRNMVWYYSSQASHVLRTCSAGFD